MKQYLQLSYQPLVSIVMPAFNAEKYIRFAIDSVLNQTYKNWELIIVNDGSIDETRKVITSYADNRVVYFDQENRGVGAARNIALAFAKGDYICFLDADDILPERSLISRLELFENNPSLEFVDGTVLLFEDSPKRRILSEWKPSYIGSPFQDLVRLGGKSFMGISWMIKKLPGKTYLFEQGLSHSEDLAFLISISQGGGLYAFTEEPILYYRQSTASAMTNIDGLAEGYRWLRRKISTYDQVSWLDKLIYQYKYKKILFLCYLRLTKEYRKAFNVLFE